LESYGTVIFSHPCKLIEYLSYKKPIISLENQKSIILDWPFLIKVNYQVNDLINFLEKYLKAMLNFRLIAIVILLKSMISIILRINI